MHSSPRCFPSCHNETRPRYLSATTADFTATIIWADGATSAATIEGSTSSSFSICGGHTYTHYLESGSVTVQVADVGGASASRSASTTVADAPIWISRPNRASTGRSVASHVVAWFSDANRFSGTGEFSATITWADGETSDGTVVKTGTCNFAITGSHAYAEDTIGVVTVDVSDAGGSAASRSTLRAACSAA